MISLIITSQGRREHLQRLLEGVVRNSLTPDEIIIVSNDTQRKDLPKSLNTKILSSPYEGFPIGKNRNYGAANASYPTLFFLDVDCIPEVQFFEKLHLDLKEFGGLCMGNPHYLKQKVNPNFTFESLHQDAIVHPHRPVVTHTRKEDDYAIFWTLCFAIERTDYDKIGGFDPQFKGYGAEDTDFAFMANQQHIDFYLSTAIAFHQQHPIYRPPVNHLEDIVYNSNVFYKKWGKWPMGSWLNEFKTKGWIVWDEDSDEAIKIIQKPSEEVVRKYYQPKARFV